MTYNCHVSLDVGAGRDGTWKDTCKVMIRHFVQKSPPVCVCLKQNENHTYVHAV